MFLQPRHAVASLGQSDEYINGRYPPAPSCLASYNLTSCTGPSISGRGPAFCCLGSSSYPTGQQGSYSISQKGGGTFRKYVEK